MLVDMAIKIPLEVDEESSRILDGQSSISNWLYNKLLEIANELRVLYRETQDKIVGQILYTKYGLRNLIPGMKITHPFLKSVYSSVLKNVGLRLTRVIKDYQNGKSGERANQTGWPNFRSFSKKWFSLEYEEPWKGYSLEGTLLKISLGKTQVTTEKGEVKNKQLGIQLKVKEALPSYFDASRVKSLRITRESNLYYAIFTISKELPDTKSTNRVVALDPNHKNLCYAVGSDKIATEIKNPWFLKK